MAIVEFTFHESLAGEIIDGAANSVRGIYCTFLFSDVWDAIRRHVTAVNPLCGQNRDRTRDEASRQMFGETHEVRFTRWR